MLVRKVINTKRVPDPTPAEIRARAAEVRARWSAEENSNRNVYYRGKYTLPVIDSRSVFLDKP